MLESSVFGLGQKLDTTKAALSFVGLVLFQIIFESFTHRLEHKFAGSVKEKIMQKLYKELMILGLVSFTVFLVYDSGIKSSGLYTFKFAHVVAFMMGIFLLLQAVIFMKATDAQAKFYDRTVATAAPEAAAAYQSTERHCLSRYKWLYPYVPKSRTRDAVELKILQLHFLRRCNLPRSFDFARYMHVGLDATVLAMVHIDAATWSIVLILALVYAAISYFSGLNTASGIVPFMLMGWATLGLTTGLWICARSSELKLLKLAGCDSSESYVAALERLAREVDVAEQLRRLREQEEEEAEAGGAEELSGSARSRGALQAALSRQRTVSFSSRKGPGFNSSDAAAVARKSSAADIIVELEAGHASPLDPEVQTAGDAAAQAGDSATTDAVRADRSSEETRQSAAANSSGAAAATTALAEHNDEDAQQRRWQPKFFTHAAAERERRSSIFRELAALSIQRNLGHSGHGHHYGHGGRTPHFSRSQRDLLKLSPELSDFRSQIYPWGSPRLLQVVRDVLLLLHVCYSALYMSNYCFVPVESYSGRTGLIVGMELVMLTPILVLAVLLVGVVRSSALLATLSRPNTEQLRQMAEDAADTTMILREFITRLRRAADRQNVGPAGLASMVREAASPRGGAGSSFVYSCDFGQKRRDSLGEQGLRKDSLKLLLGRIGHQLSEQRLRRLFRALDRNKDGVVSAEELVALVFPEAAAVGAAQQATSAEEAAADFEPAWKGDDGAGVVLAALPGRSDGKRTNSPSPCNSTNVLLTPEVQGPNALSMQETSPRSAFGVDVVAWTSSALQEQQQQQQQQQQHQEREQQKQSTRVNIEEEALPRQQPQQQQEPQQQQQQRQQQQQQEPQQRQEQQQRQQQQQELQREKPDVELTTVPAAVGAAAAAQELSTEPRPLARARTDSKQDDSGEEFWVLYSEEGESKGAGRDVAVAPTPLEAKGMQRKSSGVVAAGLPAKRSWRPSSSGDQGSNLEGV